MLAVRRFKAPAFHLALAPVEALQGKYPVRFRGKARTKNHAAAQVPFHHCHQCPGFLTRRFSLKFAFNPKVTELNVALHASQIQRSWHDLRWDMALHFNLGSETKPVGKAKKTHFKHI